VVASATIAFLAGLASIVTPCVLPLVPGYLSTVAAVDVARLDDRGVGRRVALATLPLLAGFTVVFVTLAAAAAAVATRLDAREQEHVAAFVLVVFGLGFAGLLPMPTRLVAPGLVTRARSGGSSVLLGAAFAVCAAPCIGGVLAGVLVLAGDTGSAVRGALLLASYSAGIGVAFLVAGIAFARAMTAFRWVRDRYGAIQFASGVTLVALGLLLFFDRFWWLRVYMNRAFETLGLA